MNSSHLLAIGVMVAISSGQLLFKLAADRLAERPIWHLALSPVFLVALCVYAMATLGWMMVLRRLPLSQAYPFAVLTFLLVPVVSHFVLREEISGSYWIGLALVIAGLVVIVRS